MDIFNRSKGILGEDTFIKIQDKIILVAGLGGVGGTAFEALVRTGFRKFIIVDKDVVDETNLNRQVLYTASDVGKSKVEVAVSKAKSINPEVEIASINATIDNAFLNLLNVGKIDLIIDAIDDIPAKVELVKFSKNKNIPIICSLGMANKLDPEKVTIAKINKSTVDPLGKKFRYELKRENVNYSEVFCVFSSEQPAKDGNKLNSLITVTSTAGLLIAKYVICYFKEIDL